VGQERSSPSYHAEWRGGKGLGGWSVARVFHHLPRQAGEVRGTRGERTVALHDLQELDNDLRRGADHDLALAGLLGVVDAVEGIVQDGGADHFGGCVGWRFSDRQGGNEVSASVPKRVTLAFRGSVSVESALVDDGCVLRVLPAQLPMGRAYRAGSLSRGRIFGRPMISLPGLRGGHLPVDASFLSGLSHTSMVPALRSWGWMVVVAGAGRRLKSRKFDDHQAVVARAPENLP